MWCRWRSHSKILFTSKRGSTRGHIFSCLFVITLDALFALIKSKKDVSGLNIFDLEFLYTAYADDVFFVVKDLNSAKEVLSDFKLYSNVSGLYPNLEKCEIAGIGVLKNFNVALCGMKSVNLLEHSIKILGVYISYNKKLQDNMDFQVVIKIITSVLKVW